MSFIIGQCPNCLGYCYNFVDGDRYRHISDKPEETLMLIALRYVKIKVCRFSAAYIFQVRLGIIPLLSLSGYQANNLRLVIQPLLLFWLIYPWLDIFPNSKLLLEFNYLIAAMNQFKPRFSSG